MDHLIDAIAQRPEQLGISSLLLLIAFGFATGRLPSPGAYKRMESALDKTTGTLEQATERLQSAERAHDKAEVQIEFLERERDELRAELDRCAGECDGLRQDAWRWRHRQGMRS